MVTAHRPSALAALLLLACFANSVLAGSLSDQMLALVNQARQQEGVKPLQFSQELEDAAQRKSEEEAGQTVRLRPDAVQQVTSWETRHTRNLRGSRGMRKLHMSQVQGDDSNAVNGCMSRILSQNMPNWDQDVKGLFDMSMAEAAVKSTIMSRSFTHLALAAAGTGDRVYVTLALGMCTGAAAQHAVLPS